MSELATRQVTATTTATRKARRRGPSRARLWIHVPLALGAVIMTVPFAWMVLTSLKTLGETTHIPPIIIPPIPQWINYATAVGQAPVFAEYRNTALMTLGRVAGQLVFCSLAGYAFARIEFPFRKTIFI
ncbi:MAG: carbohydrate ABC transporter permease, partial [Mycobacterium sp.]|nr:carbohydrate ABC transporter permease [Mycobacterium sp.]